ncbi:MAG TPA: hypothetical protein VFF57_05315 [Hanamia sp.]|nr:hypothetical protein [Hanamia sp.]
MAKRGMRQPETSLEAYRSLDPEKLRKSYKDIQGAVQSLGKAHFEQIASFLKVEPVKIWKRMSEARKLGLIHLTDSKEKTSSGRFAFQYAPGPAPESVERKKKVMKGKTIADYSKALIQPKLNTHNTERLF